MSVPDRLFPGLETVEPQPRHRLAFVELPQDLLDRRRYFVSKGISV